MTAELVAAALDYAARGWPVFPLHWPLPDGSCTCRDNDCGNVGKHPRTGRGFYDASTDAEIVHQWWTKWPDANIGLRTGVICDLFDIDHDDVHEGTADLEPFLMRGGPVVRTGAGWHFYVKPTGLGNRTRFTKYCDWRGEGGYSILPPSLHYSGRRYEWFAPIELALNDAPPELLRALRGETKTAPIGAASPPTRTVPIGNISDPFTRGWSAAGIIGQMVIAADHTRNNTLVWCANKIGLDLHASKATPEQAERALDQLHDAALQKGLTDKEIRATILSGFNKGKVGQPNSTKKSVS